MNDAEMDKLLEQGLSGDPPRAEFREQVLRDSVAALARVRRTRTRRRAASLAAAAVLIAGVSFLLGRHSMPATEIQPPLVAASVAAGTQGVTVPNELIEWLQTAQLFRQLGMEDRMARALDHANKLLQYDTAAAGKVTGGVVAAGDGAVEEGGKDVGPAPEADRHEPPENMNRILAQVFGE